MFTRRWEKKSERDATRHCGDTAKDRASARNEKPVRIVICSSQALTLGRVKGPPANQLPKQRAKLIFPVSSGSGLCTTSGENTEKVKDETSPLYVSSMFGPSMQIARKPVSLFVESVSNYSTSFLDENKLVASVVLIFVMQNIRI